MIEHVGVAYVASDNELGMRRLGGISAIEYDQVVTLGRQGFNDMRTDEAGSAGDEHAHERHRRDSAA